MSRRYDLTRQAQAPTIRLDVPSAPDAPRHGTRDKINRLRVRARSPQIDDTTRGVLLGMLDLLDDEL